MHVGGVHLCGALGVFDPRTVRALLPSVVSVLRFASRSSPFFDRKSQVSGNFLYSFCIFTRKFPGKDDVCTALRSCRRNFHHSLIEPG